VDSEDDFPDLERETVALIMLGDEDAEAKFFANFYPWVKKYARQLGCDEADAEDIAQNIMWEAFQHLRQGGGYK
jgi:DNA-directed RNA polymerase specialized sigma24 family protein